ncbi:MAG: HAMP domain-containing histidine kinase [Prolixibacteraceae bacterium]|jgi:two-component system, OmpR family, phosphate regulon sensor histidine kinase PhoR|nr:HAMP domain-containing histidine kinase [Prolixibacteraceae bacterium]MBT6762912.1 HAMP domain-containing histidine kinase [Prolixibacteraceae bacterium]MBT6998983.1 HAMP domain-containing histidine kinase [Prolixibacteraceae bacterium]MBT7394838.1 HAMP domain-containing histidine kinase [Prolixibacteraceae bacterium]
MKNPVKKYVLAFTLVIIIALLLIQVGWIIRSIKFQEKVFEKSVSLALNQTVANITENKGICLMMQQCIACDSLKLNLQLTSAGIWEKIHSAIDEELKSYDIDLEYDMFIVEPDSDPFEINGKEIQKGKYYSHGLYNIFQQAGYELVVRFPSKTKFFLEKTGLMFLSSVVLILLIIVSISYLLKIYQQELRIAEHTKELLNNVSHEFKTPLTSIALASNMIRKERYSGRDKLNNYANLIFKENKKLQHLVESLLHLAAIERNEFDYIKEKINLHDIIDDGVTTIEMILLETGGIIETKLEASNSEIFADKLHITNVLVNLLSNAIKYSKELPRIEISTKILDEKILVNVKDNGIGIPLKYQKFIFQNYYRVPTGDVHNSKGFGIGLAYVKKVVEAHNGSVIVESKIDKGSIFTIQLPLISFK